MGACDRPLLAIAGLLLAHMTSSPGSAAETLSLDTVFAEEGHSRSPSQVRWSRTGGTLTFLWSHDGPGDLWQLRSDQSAPERLLEAGSLTSDGQALDFATARWAADGSSFLIGRGQKPKYETAGVYDELFLYRIEGAALTALDSGRRFEDPRLSQDLRWVAFVRDANLWVVDLKGPATARQLTRDGREGEVLNGKPDWLYWEEIFGRRSLGHSWSPDSRRIAFLRFDEDGVERHPLLENAGEVLPRIYEQPYPTAGTRNPEVRVGIATAATGEIVWLSAAGDDDAYVARFGWTPTGEVYVLRLAREQDRVSLLLCDPASGRCRSFLEEAHPTWIDVANDFRFLADGRLLWGSDRDGWRRLYLYDGEGRLVGATSPDHLNVTGLEAVDETESRVYFSGFRSTAMGAKDRHLYRVALDGSGLETLAGGTGWSHSIVAPDASGWVIQHSAAGRSGSTTCVRRGAPPTPLPATPPTAYDVAALPQWDFLTIPSEGGVELPAQMLRPDDFDPTASYPAIMYHYGGPASQVVQDVLPERPWRDLWHRRQAQRGYVVLIVDNPASSFFGKQGAERLHRHFGELELAAQRAGVAFLDSLGYVDRGRIGLWGWSGGGANTLYSLFRSPGTWRAGVAGAPVTDWRLYDTVWTERYLDHPQDNPEGYREASALSWAGELQDGLLLVHGTADDNVHPHNTVMLSQALVEAGKAFEQAIYPGEKHGLSRHASRHFYERMESFFDRWLATP